MSLWNFLAKAASERPDHPALIEGGVSLTYAQAHGQALRLAGFWRSRGLLPGDRLSILDSNHLEYLIVYYAAAAGGYVLNPLNTRLSTAELAFTIADAGSRILVAGSEHQTRVRELCASPLPGLGVQWRGDAPDSRLGHWPEYSWEEATAESTERLAPRVLPMDTLAHLYYTSGTTGRPKGVMLTHRNVAEHARSAVFELGLCPTDIWGHYAPLFHLADAWATFAITLAQGTHRFLPKFEAGAALADLASGGVTITNLVPTMLNAMVKHPGGVGEGFPKLRAILSGGAPIAPDLVRRIVEFFGSDYVQTYGMTETSPYLTLSLLPPSLESLAPPLQLMWKARTGRPFRGVELLLVDEKGEPVPRDGATVGEIRVRGATVTPGYWQRPIETAAAFVDGYLRTGDLAVGFDHGFVNIVDRAKDMIITGGEKVFSTEVEAALYEHDAVLEVAVVGRPDPTWGEAVTACVVLRPGKAASADELLLHAKSRLSSFKVPKRIEFHAELPKTGTGKITKLELRSGPGSGQG